jgi:hypothetical protein
MVHNRQSVKSLFRPNSPSVLALQDHARLRTEATAATLMAQPFVNKYTWSSTYDRHPF